MAGTETLGVFHDGALHGEPASPSAAASAGSALLDLLDEGWFAGNLWSGGGWSGGLSLSTIKEAQNEAEDQPDEDDLPRDRVEAPQGMGSPRERPPRTREPLFPSPAKEPPKADDDHPDAPELPRDAAAADGDNVGLVPGRQWPGTSPYSSDEETVQLSRQGRRRGRSVVRRRTKRSSSAENARGSWVGESRDGLQALAAKPSSARGSATPPLTSSGAPGDDRPSGPRFLRTRSVSDYEAAGQRVASLWDTPPGSRSKAKSLTDADVEELQGFFDLGFKFPQGQLSPQITATLPALRLYQKIGTVQQRLLQQHQPLGAPESAAPLAISPSPEGSPAEANESGESRSRSASLPLESSWSIADPSDNPVDVKTNLRLWAQAVASTVRQTC